MILGYIDPGQGMLIWQAIVSAFIGFLFYLKKSRDFIVGLFRKFVGIFRSGQKAAADDVVAPKKISAVPIEAEIEAR